MTPEASPDTGYGMLSDQFLADFKRAVTPVMKRHTVATAWSSNHEGAHDHVLDSRVRAAKRQMANDRMGGGMRRTAMARDQLNDFHPETVNNIMRLVEESFPEDVSSKLMKILYELCPGVLGDMPGLDDEHGDMEATDAGANPNPNSRIEGRTEALRHPGPAAQDMPPPFPGRPTPGGRPLASDSMTITRGEFDYYSMFPDARRIGADPCPPRPTNNAVTPTVVGPTRRGRSTSDGMAMDSKSISSYQKMGFGSPFQRVV